MTFTGNENHDISLDEASRWTKNYRVANPGTGTVTAHAFGKNAISEILNQTGCFGLRIYYALDDENIKQVILVGVDADGNDLYNGSLAERSFNCPPSCAVSSPLNSNDF